MVVTVRTSKASGFTGLGEFMGDVFTRIEDDALSAMLPAVDSSWQLKAGLVPISTAGIGDWHYNVTVRAVDESMACMRGLAALALLSQFNGSWTGIYAEANSLTDIRGNKEVRWRVTITRKKDAELESVPDLRVEYPVVASIHDIWAEFVKEDDGDLAEWLERSCDALANVCLDLGYTYEPVTQQQRALMLYAMDEETDHFLIVLAGLWSLVHSGAIDGNQTFLRAELDRYAAEDYDVTYTGWQPLPELPEVVPVPAAKVAVASSPDADQETYKYGVSQGVVYVAVTFEGVPGWGFAEGDEECRVLTDGAGSNVMLDKQALCDSLQQLIGHPLDDASPWRFKEAVPIQSLPLAMTYSPVLQT